MQIPRNGTRSPWTRSVSAPTRSCSTSESMVARAAPTPGRMMRSARRDLVGGVDETRRQSEVLEGVQHARCVSGPVVDDVDHPRPRVANAVQLARRSIGSPRRSDPLRDAPLRAAPPLPLLAVAALAALLVPVLLVALALSSRLPPASAPPPRRHRRTARPVGGRAGHGPVAPHRRPARRVLPAAQRAARTAPPARPCSSSREMFVTEGNRYNVRGDIAFAQSIVETAWFNYPRQRDGAAVQQQLRRHRRVRHRAATASSSPARSPACARRCSCCATTPTARRRTANIPDPPVPELWGSTRRPRRTTSTTTSPRGTRRSGTTWATATGRRRPNYATVVLSVYNQMLTDSGQAGQCPPDGLLFGPLTAAGSVPGQPAPAGSRDRRHAVGRLLRPQRQRQRDRVQRRAVLRVTARVRRRLRSATSR